MIEPWRYKRVCWNIRTGKVCERGGGGGGGLVFLVQDRCKITALRKI